MSETCKWIMFHGSDFGELLSTVANSYINQEHKAVILDCCIVENNDYGEWDATIYYAGVWK